MSKVSITARADGSPAVLVDEQDISQVVTGVEIALARSNRPVVRLDLGVLDTADLTDVDVDIASHTREALVAIGWTPPAAKGGKPT